jgi:hypothetical protein
LMSTFQTLMCLLVPQTLCFLYLLLLYVIDERFFN